MDISNRERFKAIARFQRPGDLLIYEMIFPETLENWVKQGAPKEILSQDGIFVGNPLFRGYFQLGNKEKIPRIQSSGGSGFGLTEIGYGITTLGGSPLVPDFKPTVVAEDDRTITYVNGTGQTVRSVKNKSYSMPMFIDWPVKDRATWNDIKKRLNPNTPERWPENWDAYVQELNGQDDPVALMLGGLFHLPREWIGNENILYMFHDDPGLIDDMMEHLLYLETEIIKRVVKDIKVDEAEFSEDIAFKTGPLISPDMVRKYMVPRYKKITEMLHSNGIDIIFMDSDGNLTELVPLWLESGINYVWPLEQAAGNDAVALRKKYGKELVIGGTIDKRALIKGKEAIKEEIMSKVPFLLEKGGYFPSVDHLVPPNVTFENYCYYINMLRDIAGLEKLLF
jgi:hypothetical protein